MQRPYAYLKYSTLAEATAAIKMFKGRGCTVSTAFLQDNGLYVITVIW